MPAIPGLTSARARKMFWSKEQADQRFADVGGVSQARIKVQPIRVDASIATGKLYADSASPIASGGRTFRYASGAWGLVGTRTIKTGTNGEIYSRQSAIASDYEPLQWGARFGAVITDAALPSIDLGIALLSGSQVARIHPKVDGVWLTASPIEFTTLEGGATIISTGSGTGTGALAYNLALPLGAHEVEIYISGARINYVRTPVKNVVYPIAPSDLSVAFLGASFIADRYSWCTMFRRLTGAEVFQCGVAGSGVLAAPAAPDAALVYNNTARIDAWYATQAEKSYIEFSGNEPPTATFAELRDAKIAYLDALEARRPGHPFIIGDVPPRGYADSIANKTAVNLASTRAAINARPNMNIIGYRDTIGTITDTPRYSALVGTSIPAGQRSINIGAIWESTVAIASVPSTFNTRDHKMFGYYTGTGTNGAPTGNGCRDGLMGADTDVTHPLSPIGYDVMGRYNTPFIVESIARNTRVPVLARASA